MIAAISVPGLGTLKKASARRGHNLLEVIIACMLFSTLMVLFSGLWAQYYKSQSISRNHLAATSLGRKVLEEHLSAGYGANPNGYTEDNAIISETRVRGRDANCEFKYHFESVDRGPDFRELTVTVSWKDQTGDHDLKYGTFIYRTQ